MNRRALILGAGSALLLPSIALAESATPEPSERKYLTDFVSPEYTRPMRAVYRSFELPNQSLFEDNLLWLSVFGMQFAEQKDAGDFVQEFARAYHESEGYELDAGLAVSEMKRASVRALGDETWAWSYQLVNEENDRSWERGVIATVQGSWAQLAIGSTLFASAVKLVAGISEVTLSRWPNDEAESETQTNGMFEHGIWETLPTLSDVPEGMTLDDDRAFSF